MAKLYSQSAGLAAFLMDGEEGRYREPLVRLSARPSTPAATTRNSLSDATGTSYAELDAAYRRYLESLP